MGKNNGLSCITKPTYNYRKRFIRNTQGGFVIITFKRPAKNSNTAQVEVNISPKSRRLLREQYINQALEQRHIVMTHPESPQHPQQKYKLTEKGIIILNAISEESV